MSSESDNEEFFDAEDATPIHGSKKYKKRDSLSKRANSEPNVSCMEPDDSNKSSGTEKDVQQPLDNVFVEPKVVHGGRRKFRELRQKLQTEDEDCNSANQTPPNSQTSSVEGVYASTKTSHPFRVIELDTLSLQSINSLGRMGRILAGQNVEQIAEAQTKKVSSVSALSSSQSSHTSSSQSSKAASKFPSMVTLTAINAEMLATNNVTNNNVTTALPDPQNNNACGNIVTPPTPTVFHEPDVIASTKNSNNNAPKLNDSSQHQSAPIAPPRRKKKNVTRTAQTPPNTPLPAQKDPSKQSAASHQLDSALERGGATSSSTSSSKASTIRSVYSLNIQQALGGGPFVVKPQDSDAGKGAGPPGEQVRKGEELLQKGGDVEEEKGSDSATAARGSANRSSVGHYSLGPHRSCHHQSSAQMSLLGVAHNTTPIHQSTSMGVTAGNSSTRRRRSRERRKSAGDERPSSRGGGAGGRAGGGVGGSSAPVTSSSSSSTPFGNMHIHVRTRTDSGKQLTDLEILQQVTVLNLDTGERIPLSVAEDKLPQCVNPLSLHIMRLTSEYVGGSRDEGGANLIVGVASAKGSQKDVSGGSKMGGSAEGTPLRRGSSADGKVDQGGSVEEDYEEDEEDVGSRGVSGSEEDDDDGADSVASAPAVTSRIKRKLWLHKSISKLPKSFSVDPPSDTISMGGVSIGPPGTMGGRVKRRTAKIRKFFGSTVKKTMHAARSIAHEVGGRGGRDDAGIVTPSAANSSAEGGANTGDALQPPIKVKASSAHKGPYDFEKVQHVQDLSGEHEGPIWCMKFSGCGRLLATAGQDRLLRIWTLRDAYPFFQEMRAKYAPEKVSPSPSQESLVSHHSLDDASHLLHSDSASSPLDPASLSRLVFTPRPFCVYAGHTSDLLDVSWSRNYFLLSSSMDKTVRLWHISRKECLCCFQHIDFVTAIAFHPRDDRYFLSGSLDGKIRLWNIPDKKVSVWNEVEGTTRLITAANFCQNGKFAVVGSYDGRCIFYNTDQLKYHTQIQVRSARGRNASGRKISGIEPMPGEDKILVTSNDSRIRLYDLRDLNMSCKYRGYSNFSSQIRASFSHDGTYVVSGSENGDIYIWKTCHDYGGGKFAAAAASATARRDRNDYWEAIRAHNAVVTCAIFAPHPDAIIKMLDEAAAQASQAHCEPDAQSVGSGGSSVGAFSEGGTHAVGGNTVIKEKDNKKGEDPMVEQRKKGCGGYVLVSADFGGCIKVFVNRMKPKHSSLPASALA